MALSITETLLTPSSIKLFGRVVSSLTYKSDTGGTGLGENKFLQRQLEAKGDNLPTLARIYAFSFEGAYYELPRPPIFLVHGSGTPVGSWANPSTVAQAGVAARDWDFSGNYDPTYNPDPSARSARAGASPSHTPPPPPPPPPPSTTDIYYWEYEKGDFSLRLDLDAGPFEQILLQMALRGGGGVSGAGVSGAGVSGAGVSGAGVSGAGVSGAGVSGAGVSGAGVRR
jgi:hypothetical protein